MARAIFLAALIPLCAACGGWHNDEEKDSQLVDIVIQKIIDMHNIVDDDKRADEAEYVDSLIGKNFTSIDKKQAVAELKKYLSDKNDAVVYWTAMSLSQFGKDAKPALPKLKEVLKIKEKLIGSKTSASGIRLAISRIED